MRHALHCKKFENSKPNFSVEMVRKTAPMNASMMELFVEGLREAGLRRPIGDRMSRIGILGNCPSESGRFRFRIRVPLAKLCREMRRAG